MIRRKINKISALVFAILTVVNIAQAQIISPFNKLEIKDSSVNYSFIVSGHFHGASTNASTFPAASLQANIDTLNLLHPSFLMSLGDMFLDVNNNTIIHYQKSLFDKLKMPLLNSVGNHDVSNGNMYEKVFGKTFFSFTKGAELFIILNTEQDDGSIKNEQLEFFKNAVVSASSNKIKNVFIFSHRPVWAESNEHYNRFFQNNTHTEIGNNNFETTIRPLIEPLSKEKKVIWISGSLGGGASSFFYNQEANSNLIFMQTAIRDEPRDAALLILVDNGNITFKGISFSGQQLKPIESYGVDYWSSNSAPETKFNFRLLPYLIKQMLMHHYFWIGFFTACFFFLIYFILKRKRMRKNTAHNH